MPEKIEPYAEYTDAELLALVRQAIAEIVTYGKSYAIRGREMSRANLDDLRNFQTDLERRIAAADSGGTGIAVNQVAFGRA